MELSKNSKFKNTKRNKIIKKLIKKVNIIREKKRCDHPYTFDTFSEKRNS